MAGKKEVQKTVAFRLNLSRADERELYQAIMKHGRNMENDIYGEQITRSRCVRHLADS